MEYKINLNKITISENNKYLYIELFNNKIIEIYRVKNDTQFIELNLRKYNKNIDIKKIKEKISINFNNFNIIINSIDEVSIYKNNKLINTINLETRYDEYEKKNYYATLLKLNNSSHVFGLGDKMSYLNKIGYYFKSYNTDDSNHQDELFPSLYKSINYFLYEEDLFYLGFFFPSSYLYTFDIGKKNLKEFSINNFNEDIDFYLILGEDPKEITKNYSNLVGHPYLVRFKMLGYNQSRWSYEDTKMVKEVYNNFNNFDLPLDYIHLDIHHMDGYRDFTIDKTRFNDLKGLTEELKKDDIELVAINDAAIKEDDNYYIFKYLKKNKLFATLDNEIYINEVWPGKSAFPNYFDKNTKKYFEEVATKFLEDTGISGIWCDMNEPASFKGELPKEVIFKVKNKNYYHDKMHNIYGEHMVKSFVKTFTKKNIRPYLFTRAAFSTTAKYSFVWNGDNFSLWHHLRYSLTQNLSLSLSNFMFNGVDIGGFGGDANKELLIRWLESNLFMPFLRNHSSLHTKSQEPYAYDLETINVFKKYLNIRYNFVPYLYNLVYRMNKYGEMIIRPIFINYPLDKKTLQINDEYMVGESLLVAPILEMDKRERIVYFPKGNWIDLLTNKIYKGNKSYIINMNLEDSGYFIKSNSIIPEFKNIKRLNKEKIDTLVLKLYGNKGHIKLYDDDGISLNYKAKEYNIYDISFNKNNFRFNTIKKGYLTPYKKIIIEYNNIKKEVEFNYNFTLNIGE